jgi:hypothetical protein
MFKKKNLSFLCPGKITRAALAEMFKKKNLSSLYLGTRPEGKGNKEKEGIGKERGIFREGGRGRYSAESSGAEYSERNG